MATDKGSPVVITSGFTTGGAGTLVYTLPSAPTGIVAKVKKMTLSNLGGADAVVYFKDAITGNITIATQLAHAPFNVANGETAILDESDFGEFVVGTGLLAGVGGGGSGSDFWIEVTEVEIIGA